MIRDHFQTELGIINTKAALAIVDTTYFDSVILSYENDAAYLARHLGLKSSMWMSSTTLRSIAFMEVALKE